LDLARCFSEQTPMRKTEGMSDIAIKRIDAWTLKAQLHDGREMALLDAREELPFGKRHLLMASHVPLSRLELLVDDLVPRRGARAVWCDDGEGVAARAAERMVALGYQDVSCSAFARTAASAQPMPREAGASLPRSFTLAAADEKGPIAVRAYFDEPFRVDGTEARAGTL
jgi:rhodanese-related sulfurtransferase